MIACAAAEVLHGLGDGRQAAQYLDHVRLIGNEMGSFNLQFRGYLLESQFACDQGREEVGVAALRRALAIGRERGLSFSHWFLPTTMARLCAKALEADIEVDYVRDLIRIARLVPDGDMSTNEAWPWPVKIYTLGRFEIWLDGRPLPPRRKAPYQILRLLKAIVALGGEGVPVSRLTDTLWPDAEGDTGQENLHKSLQRLRRLLAIDDLLQVRDGKISLNRQRCWIDATAFQILLNGTGDSTHRPGQPDARGRRYEQAIALYRGPFLDEDGASDWAEHCREHLRHQFVRTVQHVSDSKKAEGQEEAAVACLENGLKADPLAEPLYLHLITWCQAAGRQNDAKSLWTQYRRAVVAAGMEPSAEMQRLAKDLS